MVKLSKRFLVVLQEEQNLRLQKDRKKEELRKQEEELQRQAEEENAKRKKEEQARQAEEAKRKDEERKRKEEEKKRKEEEKRKQEEERKKKEEKKRKEEEKKREEKRRQEEENLRKKQEEEKRKREELKKQEEKQKKEEEKRKKLEEEQRKQEEERMRYDLLDPLSVMMIKLIDSKGIIYILILGKKLKHVSRLKQKNKPDERSRGDEKRKHCESCKKEVKHRGHRHLVPQLLLFQLLRLLKSKDLSGRKKWYIIAIIYNHVKYTLELHKLYPIAGRTTVSTDDAAATSAAESYRSCSRSVGY